MIFTNWTKAKKIHHTVLLTGMILSIAAFGLGRELLAAGIVVASVAGLMIIKRTTDEPVYDERDIDIAEESTHQAVMLTGTLGGIIMIVISIGMGLGKWSYPDWIAPYYLTWGGIILLTLIIEAFKRLGGKK